MKIVVIDDCDSIRKLFDVAVRKIEGQAILIDPREFSLKEIIDKIEQENPDIIYLDHELGRDDYSGNNVYISCSDDIKERTFSISSHYVTYVPKDHNIGKSIMKICTHILSQKSAA